MLKKLLVLFIALSVGFTSTIDVRASIEDTTPPLVSGVEEGGIYKAPVTIEFDEGTALLNDVEIVNPTTVSELGTYVLIVTDLSSNVTTVNFSLVDGVAPVVTGVEEGGIYKLPVTIEFNEGTALLNDVVIDNFTTVSALGEYVLVVTDADANVTTVNFKLVDGVAPVVTGVEEGGIYKLPVTIEFNEGTALLNDVVIDNFTTVSALGEYVLVVTDADANVTTVNFKLVDGVAPVVTGVTKGASYTDPVTISFNEGVATLNGKAFISGSIVSAHGAYTLVVTDVEKNVTTITFTIVPKTVGVIGLSVVNAGYDAISLTWTAVSNITGYEIWRSTGTSTTYTLVTTVNTNKFVNTGLAFNTQYNYKVRIVTVVNTVKTYGGYSAIASATTALTPPVTTVVSDSYTSIRVSWAAIPGASGYEVYRATSLTGTYTLLTTTTSTSYLNTTLTTNSLYFYKVRAYRTVGTLKYYSGYSTVLSTRPVPSQVSGNTLVSTGYNSLNASWTAVAGANGYEVYKSMTLNGTYSLVTTTASLSYAFGSLVTNVSLFVKVRAYRLVGTTKVYGPFSTVMTNAPIPSTPVVSLTSLSYKSLKLSWAAIPGVNGYEVYHQVNGVYVLVQDNASLTLTVDGLVSGAVHAYKVKAYRVEGTTRVYSKEALISGKALPSVPSVSAQINYNAVTLRWAAIAGASGYEIHRSATSTGTFVLASTVTTLEGTIGSLAFNTSYYFKVRAYVLVNNVKIYGDFTGVLGYKTEVATPVVTLTSASYNSVKVSWAAVSGASGYQVYRATSVSGTYTLMTTTTTPSYTNTSLTPYGTYYYKVRAYRTIGTTKSYSAYSAPLLMRPVPTAPTGTSLISNGFDSVKLSWAAVVGASGYEVYTSGSTNGTYVLKSTTSALTVTLGGQLTNVAVYAKVRAYRLIGTVKAYGAFSSVLNVNPIPSKPVVTVANLSHTSIQVVWPLVAGANGYEVYHLVGSTYQLVQDSNALSLTVTGLISGEVHTYKVVAYRLVNNVKVRSLETIASGKAFPLTPVVTSLINYASIQLNWAVVEGAAGYEVVRSTTSTGTYGVLANVTTNTYLNAGLAFNTTYYYKVRAYALVNSVKIYGNYTAVLPYKTSVASPVVSAVSTSYISTNVSWPAVSGASGYEVSRATVLAGPFTVLSAAQTGLSYANTGLTTNTLYYYRVRSYRLVGTVKNYSAYSTVVSVRPVPAISSSVTVASNGYDSVKISWAAVTGASGYEVFTSNVSNGTYALKSTTTALTVNVSGYPTVSQVYAKVRAYRLVGTTKVYGALSNSGVGQPYPSKPVVSVSYPSATSVKLSWPAVPGATGYLIQYLGDFGSQVISKQPEREFTMIDCTPGVGYYFTVITYIELGFGGEATSEGTNIYTVPVPPSVKNFNVNSIDFSEIFLKWDAVPGAVGYEIYRSTSATGTFTLFKDTKDTVFSDFPLTFNTSYYYKIRAYAFGKTATIFGAYSAVITGRTGLKTPNVSLSTVSPTSIKIQWPTVLGAVKYEIHRSTTATGTYTLIGTSTSTEYTNTGLTLGASYYYKVRAIHVVGVTNNYSGFSTPVLGKTTLNTPSYLFVSDIASTALTLSWSTSQGASGYELIAALYPSTEYTLIYSGAADTMKHINLQPNQRYNYKIRSYATVNGVKIYSAYSAQAVQGFVGVNVPQLKVRQKDDMDIEFYYEEGTDRTFQNGVEIYLVDPVTKALTLYKTAWSLSKFTFSDYVGKSNLTLTYVFVGLNYGSDNVLMKSQASEPVTLVLRNPTPTGFYVSNVEKTRVSLVWDYSVTPMELWRSDTIDGEYKMLQSWTTGSWFYDDSAVELGKKYFYKLRRISVDQQTMLNAYSEFTNPLHVGPGFLKPYLESRALTPYEISYTTRAQLSADGYEICEVNESGTIIGACPAVDLDFYTGTLEVDDNTTYHLVARAYINMPDGSKFYSEFSDPITVTTPLAPNLVISTVTSYDNQATVTFDFKNNGGRAIEIIGIPTYVYDINDARAEYPAVMKDGANVQITRKTIGAGVTQRVTFAITTPNIVFNSNRFLAFQVVYDGYEYVLCYSPYLGIFYFAYF